MHDTFMSTISYNMNEVMKILSIIATVMMPLTFITGIYAANQIINQNPKKAKN